MSQMYIFVIDAQTAPVVNMYYKSCQIDLGPKFDYDNLRSPVIIM